MAMRNEFPIHAVNPGLIIAAGSFAGNDGASPVASTRTGVGFSVTWVSTGLYRVQLGSSTSVPAGLLPATDKYLNLIAGLATVQGTGATIDRIVTIKASTPSTGVFDFEVKTAAALTNLTSTDRLNFLLLLSDSVVLPVRG
jgi:hypothetical protein